MVSTECAARRCSAGDALAGITIATVTSLRHRPTTDSHDRRVLAEVRTVPVLLINFIYLILRHVSYNYSVKYSIYTVFKTFVCF